MYWPTTLYSDRHCDKQMKLPFTVQGNHGTDDKDQSKEKKSKNKGIKV